MKINSKNSFLAIFLTGLLFLATPVTASIVSLTDDFDSETAGLDYTSFANWDVINGSVDSISSGTYDINCDGGSGLCLDLDGGTRDAGDLVSKEEFAPGEYQLQFSFSGHPQPAGNGIDSVTVSMGDFTESFDIDPSNPFSSITRTVNVGSNGGKLTFSHSGGDNYGAILDSVSVAGTENAEVARVAAVPVPAAIWLFGSCILGFFGMRRLR